MSTSFIFDSTAVGMISQKHILFSISLLLEPVLLNKTS
mgnify:CR=1 FL=1